MQPAASCVEKVVQQVFATFDRQLQISNRKHNGCSKFQFCP